MKMIEVRSAYDVNHHLGWFPADAYSIDYGRRLRVPIYQFPPIGMWREESIMPDPRASIEVVEFEYEIIQEYKSGNRNDPHRWGAYKTWEQDIRKLMRLRDFVVNPKCRGAEVYPPMMVADGRMTDFPANLMPGGVHYVPDLRKELHLFRSSEEIERMRRESEANQKKKKKTNLLLLCEA